MPISDLYQLLLQGQGQIGGLGAAGGAGILGAGSPYRTPGINPAATDPGVDPSGGAAPGLLAGLDPAAARRQAILAAGASLLQSGRTTTGPRINGAEALGNAIQAGQQGYQGGIDNQLNQLLLQTKIQQAKAGGNDPALVAEYKFAKENGFTGTFQEYIRAKNRQDDGLGNVNPGDYDPASVQAYLGSRTTENPNGDFSKLKRYVAPAQPTVQVVNGVPTVVNPSRTGGPVTQTPLSTLQQVTDAANKIKASEAKGTATGGAEGAAEAAVTTKGVQANTVLGLTSMARELLPKSTGSPIGAGADAVAGAFGVGTEGAKAVSQLKVIQAGLVLGLPRLEGPQSDRDTSLYKEAAGLVGDATVPVEIRQAALDTIEQIQRKYAAAFEAQKGGAKAGDNPAPANRPPIGSFWKN